MAVLIFPHRWRRQPPFQTRLRASVFGGRPVLGYNFYQFGSEAVDLVSGFKSTNGAGTGWQVTEHGVTQKYSGSGLGTKIASGGMGSVVPGSQDLWVILRGYCPDNANARRAVLHDANDTSGGTSFAFERYGNDVWRTNISGIFDEYHYFGSTLGWFTYVFHHRVGGSVSCAINGNRSIHAGPYSSRGGGTSLRLGSFGDYGSLFFNGNASYLLIGTGAFNFDAAVDGLLSNVWAPFDPLPRRIYVPSAGGGGSSDHALTESSSAADSLAAAAAFAAASAESSAAAETLAAILQAQASAAESVAASDTLAAAADTLAAAAQSSVAAGESAAAADTLAATGYQRGAPDADVDVGAWLASTGADLAALLRDADSGTYIYTTSKESAYLADVKRASGSDLDDPGADAGYEIVVELAGGYTPSGEIEVEVLQGATVIATRTISSPVAGQTYTWTCGSA